MEHCHDRFCVRTEGTAGDRRLYPLIKTSRVKACRTAARITRYGNFLSVYLCKLGHKVEGSAYVPRALADRGSSEHKSIVRLKATIMTSVCGIGRLALAHRSLLYAKRGKAVLDRL